MSNFASMKNKKTNASKLKDKIQDNTAGNRDERFWRPDYDKETFVGSALIRFLPRYDSDGDITLPWVSWKEFYFMNKQNQKYNHRSLVTIGKEDPVANLNRAHWAMMNDTQKDGAEGKEAKKRNVRMQYVANIVVLDDPKHPENNGKVFLYKFGNQIKKKLEAVWFPEYEDQTPIEFFDWDEGANLRIRSKKADFGKMPTYEDSVVEGVSALADGRQEIQEKIFNSLHDLSEFESEDNYKSYEELEKEMLKVLGARYVARIMGEEYSPEKAAASGANPFEPNQAVEQSNQFTEPEPKSSDNEHDPFKEVEQKADGTSDKQVDPFKNATATGQEDPFANINLD